MPGMRSGAGGEIREHHLLLPPAQVAEEGNPDPAVRRAEDDDCLRTVRMREYDCRKLNIEAGNR